MIDSLPSPSPAPANIPGISAAPGPTPVGPEQAGASNGSAASKPQDSFANTLQNRIKAMAINKGPNNRAPSLPDAVDARQLQATLAFALANQNKAAPVAEIAPAMMSAIASSKSAAVEETSTNTGSDDDSASIQTIETSIPPVLIALPGSPNTSNTIPISSMVAKDGRQQRNDSSTSAPLDSHAPDSEPAAILAATAENSGREPLRVGNNAGDGNFVDMLKTALPLNGNNPIQSQLQTQPINLPPPVREVPTPMTSATWGSDVGNQLSWMVGQRESRADLVLNPPQLGRIEVSITLNGDQASATFVSANPEVRDALQGSLPRLREVLADAGVFLGQANIGAESFKQNGNEAEKGRNSPGDSFSSAGATLLGSTNAKGTVEGSPLIARGLGLIDLFA